MKSIDFLPDIYRKGRAALRRARVWWAAVVVVFACAIGASTAAQVWLRQSLARQFDELTVAYEAAQIQVREMSTLQAQIATAGQEAGLFTYLDHPWPRTQLLAEVVGPMPHAIKLTQLSILEEELARPVTEAGPRRAGGPEESAPKLAPAEQDLVRLQDQADRRQTVIELDGVTTDVPSLHQYLAELSRSPLIASANMKSLESAPDKQQGKQQGKTQFTVRLVVRPGYGQRGNEASAAPGAPQLPPLQTRAVPSLPGPATQPMAQPTAVGGAE